MPALIICFAFLKQKTARRRLLHSLNPRPLGRVLMSAFRVLLAPPRLVQADLFSLHFPRVAGHEARGAERRLDGSIEFDERARQAVAHRARLTGLAAAV